MRILLFALSVLFVSCTNKSEEKEAQPKEEFEMYEISEMAGLMEQMYVENTRLKERIMSNDSLGKFPEYFNKIEKAFNEMVDQCITCHEVKCGGPIMRIKKLYIK